MIRTQIRSTLEAIGAISADTVIKFAEQTRDAQVPVWRDSNSGVIFIEDFYVGDSEYREGRYRSPGQSKEDALDTKRRLSTLKKHYLDRYILDFGCGEGSFIKAAAPLSREAWAVELETRQIRALSEAGISCVTDIAQIVGLIDSAFMFHVLEHLPDPLTVLQQIYSRLKSGSGVLVVEVPHARDFLLDRLQLESFRNFTLWSQHLVLHTRSSLTALLEAAGFIDVTVQGVQRYGVANHLTWATTGLPGGHLSEIALLETEGLAREYEQALASIDCTDTLLAIAHVP